MLIKIPILVVLGCTLVFLATVSNGLRWEEDEDTIGIDGRDDSEITEEEFEIIEESTTTAENGCTTSEGIVGSCVSLEECYPYAEFLNDSGIDRQMLGRLEQLINNKTPCDSGDDKICCPNYGYAPIKNRPLGSWHSTKTPSVTTTTAPSVPITNVPELKEAGKGCGNLTYISDPTVIGGRDARIGEFPWIVSIHSGGRHVCGGSIIDESNILTAAHCVVNTKNVNSLELVFGTNVASSKTTSRKAAKIWYNKHYTDKTFKNDIAIIRLAQKLVYTNLIQPVCLFAGTPPLNTPGVDTKADLAGWGRTREGGAAATSLKTASLKVWTNSDCAMKYKAVPGTPTIQESMVCASAGCPEVCKDACQGDSGGPLTLNIEGRAHQVGVVSWGVGCGRYPGVYSRVDKLSTWIEEQRKRQG